MCHTVCSYLLCETLLLPFAVNRWNKIIYPIKVILYSEDKRIGCSAIGFWLDQSIMYSTDWNVEWGWMLPHVSSNWAIVLCVTFPMSRKESESLCRLHIKSVSVCVSVVCVSVCVSVRLCVCAVSGLFVHHWCVSTRRQRCGFCLVSVLHL